MPRGFISPLPSSLCYSLLEATILKGIKMVPGRALNGGEAALNPGLALPPNSFCDIE